MQRILIADDDDGLRGALGEFLGRLGYQILEAADGNAALRMVRDRDPLLSILDFHMPGMTGLEILRELRSWDSGPGASAHGTRLPCILMSAEATPDERDEAIAIGAYGFFPKPFDLPRLLSCVDEMIRTFGPDSIGLLRNLDLARLLPPRAEGASLPVPLQFFLDLQTRLQAELRARFADKIRQPEPHDPAKPPRHEPRAPRSDV